MGIFWIASIDWRAQDGVGVDDTKFVFNTLVHRYSILSPSISVENRGTSLAFG